MEAQTAKSREIVEVRRNAHTREVGSLLNLLDAERGVLELEHELEALRRRSVEIGHELASLRAEERAFVDEWRRRAGEELIATVRDRNQAMEELVKADRRQALVQLRAPEDAIVLEIADRSVGSVVREAESLLTLVPVGGTNEVEAEIEARDVGLVRTGDPVRIKLEAFPFQRHGTLSGTLRTISADAFEREPQRGVGAFFKARVSLAEPMALKDLPDDFTLTPGLEAVAEIRVKTRSVLSYFLYPVIRVLDESIREP
ncbi:MAG: HlyD family efflux transporter periplasmic adaptor subunit [Candidatus Competibacteraceae bacterium]|nr:HlyD family efflux transporter periplasmic adaptor subunit [Candidatus Competibacteraceae bacterium]